jgi:cholesterol transport system auxiliary component
MQLNRYFCLSILSIFFVGCTSLPQVVTSQYTLKSYGTTRVSSHQPKLPSIYISPPEAVAGFQTDQMLYTKVPYQTTAYVHNAWSSPPAEMLYPLLIQSFQASHAFRVVGSGTHAEISSYRLDTQLLELIQNHKTKPSRIQLTVKAMISNTASAKVIASKVFYINVPCPYDSPYGGALAANIATAQLTKQLTSYTITVIRHHTL